MSGIYIPGMEMPTTGLYFVSVDNTGGKDKTVVTVERMLGNRDVRTIIGSYEIIPVPDHGRLIDADTLMLWVDMHGTNRFGMLDEDIREFINSAPTIIPGEEVDK